MSDAMITLLLAYAVLGGIAILFTMPPVHTDYQCGIVDGEISYCIRRE